MTHDPLPLARNGLRPSVPQAIAGSGSALISRERFGAFVDDLLDLSAVPSARADGDSGETPNAVLCECLIKYVVCTPGVLSSAL